MLIAWLVHHLRKAGLTDSADDPFERILGSTAFAAVPDNLQILLPTDDGRVALHTKGRVIFPSKAIYLRLKGHDFEEVNPALTDLPTQMLPPKKKLFISLLQMPVRLSVGEMVNQAQANTSPKLRQLARGYYRIRKDNPPPKRQLHTR